MFLSLLNVRIGLFCRVFPGTIGRIKGGILGGFGRKDIWSVWEDQAI